MQFLLFLFITLHTHLSTSFNTSTIAHASLMLDEEEIHQFSKNAALNLLHSSFYKERNKDVILTLLDFYDWGYFYTDSKLLITEFLKRIHHAFILTNISSNILKQDPILNTLKKSRNAKDFKDFMQQASLNAPYSLNGSISSKILKHSPDLIAYTLTLRIINIENGRIEWQYTTSIQKYTTFLYNAMAEESRYGLMCSQKIKERFALREACELAIAEIWGKNIQDIPPYKIESLTFYARKACDFNSAFGCRVMGGIYDYGIGKKRDIAKAIEFYKQACYSGDKKACYNAGLLYRDIQDSRAYEFFEMALTKKHNNENSF